MDEGTWYWGSRQGLLGVCKDGVGVRVRVLRVKGWQICTKTMAHCFKPLLLSDNCCKEGFSARKVHGVVRLVDKNGQLIERGGQEGKQANQKKATNVYQKNSTHLSPHCEARMIYLICNVYIHTSSCISRSQLVVQPNFMLAVKSD